jgi:hypothetical protein
MSWKLLHFTRVARPAWQEQAHMQHTLSLALFFQIARSRFEKVAERDDTQQFLWIIPSNDREARKTGRGHAIDNGAQWLIRIGNNLICPIIAKLLPNTINHETSSCKALARWLYC